MTIRRLAPYLALAILLLSPGGALAGPSACAAPAETCLGVAGHGAPPEEDASTKSEAPAPLLERGAPPRYENGRLTVDGAARTADARLPDVSPSRPERLRERAVPSSVFTPLYLRHCSFLC